MQSHGQSLTISYASWMFKALHYEAAIFATLLFKLISVGLLKSDSAFAKQINTDVHFLKLISTNTVDIVIQNEEL